MARRVFFSFHYDDVMRANVVRNSDIVSRQYERAARFYDKSLWEEAKKQGDSAIKRMINRALEGSSVTCVLIGQHTWCRPWVRYELLKSFERGNGILGVRIHNVGLGSRTMPPRGGLLSAYNPGASILAGSGLQIEPALGPNPFDYLGFIVDYVTRQVMLCDHFNGSWRANPHFAGMSLSDVRYQLNGALSVNFAQLFPIYNWKTNNGYRSFPQWVEDAATKASH